MPIRLLGLLEALVRHRYLEGSIEPLSSGVV